MKNIHTILSELGITIPEDKKADFDKAVAENYKTSAEFEKKVNRLTEDLAAEKKRADTAVETLKGFEGKDFDAITQDRDKWKEDYEDAIAKHEEEKENQAYNEDLEAAATAAKCRDLEALKAHLDQEALRKSRNRKADMEAAINKQRTERGYLFDDNGGAPHFTGPKGNNGGGGNPNALTVENIRAIKDPTERQAKIKQFMQMKKGSNN